MRPKLLLHSRDPDIFSYLKGIKAPNLILPENESINIVAVAKEDNSGKFINGFVFTNEMEALEFYEAFNWAIGFQIYKERIGENSLFNYKLANVVGDVLNGQATFDPFDYGDDKQE